MLLFFRQFWTKWNYNKKNGVREFILIQNSGMAKLSTGVIWRIYSTYLMDSTCTTSCITALIKCHLSYHSQAGIWQHLCVHTDKHSTWNVHNISKFEWQLTEMFFRIWELTHYAYILYSTKISRGKRSQFSIFADIGGHFGSQKEKIQKPKYTYWYYILHDL